MFVVDNAIIDSVVLNWPAKENDGMVAFLAKSNLPQLYASIKAEDSFEIKYTEPYISLAGEYRGKWCRSKRRKTDAVETMKLFWTLCDGETRVWRDIKAEYMTKPIKSPMDRKLRNYEGDLICEVLNHCSDWVMTCQIERNQHVYRRHITLYLCANTVSTRDHERVAAQIQKFLAMKGYTDLEDIFGEALK